MKKLFAVILSLTLIIGPVPAAYASGGGMSKQILGLATGIMGATIITQCKMGPAQLSVMLYMAGSVVYVASEIMGGKKKAKDIDTQSADLNNLKSNMTEGGDYQKAAIEAQIKDVKSNLEFVQGRRKWMKATLAVFSAATAMAVVEIWWALPPPAGIGKTDEAFCTPNPAGSKLMTTAVAGAYAGAASMGMKGALLGGAGKVAIAKFLPKLAAAVDVSSMGATILNKAPGRIAFFAASTALVKMADNELKKEEGRYKDQLQKLEKVRGQFDASSNALAEGSTDPNGTQSFNSNPNDPTNKKYAIKELPKGSTLARACFTNASGQMDYSEAGCKSPYKFTRPKFDANLNIPTLLSAANTSLDLGQAIADGEMGKADVAAGNLAAMAGRLEAVKDGLVKKANDKLIAEGKKPIDVNGEINRQIAAFNSSQNKLQPGSGDLSMADLNGGEASVADTKEDEVPAIQTASAPAEVALPDTGLSNLSENSLIGSGTDSSMDEASGNVASLSDKLNDFESAEGDINNDSDVSLFKQVSNRYLLNYTKLFNKRKEIETPLAPAPADQ